MLFFGNGMPRSTGLRMMREFGGSSLAILDLGTTVLPVLVMVVSFPIAD